MSHLYLLGVATLTLTSAGFAGSDTNADLQARLEAAETRINELSVATNNNWLNDARSDEIRSLVHDVLADADTRASLQGSGSTAGYNGGFTVGSADGNWSLTMNGLLQTVWVKQDLGTPGTDTDGGFAAPNNWMNFSGTIAGDYSYDVRYNWDTRTTEFANGTLNLGDGWDLTMGTYRVHTNRLQMVDDQNQTVLGNSENAFVGNGVSLSYSGDDIRFWADMMNSSNGTGSVNDGDYNMNLRAEYMVEGTWSQFDQFTSADGGAAGTLIGLSYASITNNGLAADTVFTVAGLGALDGDSMWTVDAQMSFGGSNLYVAYTDYSDDGAGVFGDFDVLHVEGGYYLNSDWELYAAYDAFDPTTAGAGFNAVTVGLNNYWAGQNAKWTIEWSEVDPDLAGATDLTQFATQLQFYF